MAIKLVANCCNSSPDSIKRGQDSLSLNEVGFLTRGRPLGLTVDCKPNRLTVDSTHSRSPKGHPLLAESRTADSAFSVSGWLTRSIHPRERGIGQEESKGGFGSGFWFQCQSDPQRHSSSRETHLAGWQCFGVVGEAVMMISPDRRQ